MQKQYALCLYHLHYYLGQTVFHSFIHSYKYTRVGQSEYAMKITEL